MMKMLRNKRGQGMVEYALLMAVVVGIVIFAREPIKNAVTAAFVKTETAVTAANVS
jgi:Flp pilus assembly pilin Flp